MGLPRLKFFVKKNPEFGSTEPIVFMTPEELIDFQGYEPSKRPVEYDEYVRRHTADVERIRSCELSVDKVAITDATEEAITKEIESSPDFVRWM